MCDSSNRSIIAETGTKMMICAILCTKMNTHVRYAPCVRSTAPTATFLVVVV